MGLTRYAPTPSGFIHFGNAFNFLLTSMLAKEENLAIHLRIDDMDKTRFREEYLEDIFRALKWLDLDYDHGPKDAKDFHASFSQHLKMHRYQESISQLLSFGRTYFCRCSRKDLEKRCGGLAYDGFCRDKKHEEGVLRFRLDEQDAKTLAQDMGDFVLLGKDRLPCYQLVSLIDDLDLGVTHIVRGQDLFASTLAQRALARALNKKEFFDVQFYFHDLALGVDGQKLSKSSGAFALKNLYEDKDGKDKFTEWIGKNLKKTRILNPGPWNKIL